VKGMSMNTLTTLRISAVIAAAALTLTGCAAAAEPAPTPPATSEHDGHGASGDTHGGHNTAANADAEASTVVTISDAWFKAAESGMSGAFGVFTNAGDQPITIVSASSPVAHMVELHETAENAGGEMEMREVTGGFTIPAGGTYVLEPGADHLMFMGLTEPLLAGVIVEVTVTFDDGTVLTFEAPVKDYAGANENYESEK